MDSKSSSDILHEQSQSTRCAKQHKQSVNQLCTTKRCLTSTTNYKENPALPEPQSQELRSELAQKVGNVVDDVQGGLAEDQISNVVDHVEGLVGNASQEAQEVADRGR